MNVTSPPPCSTVVEVSSTEMSCPRTTWVAPPGGPTSTALLGSTGALRNTTPITNGAISAAATTGQCVTRRADQAGTGPVSSGPSSGGTPSSSAVVISPARTAATTPGQTKISTR